MGGGSFRKTSHINEAYPGNHSSSVALYPCQDCGVTLGVRCEYTLHGMPVHFSLQRVCSHARGQFCIVSSTVSSERKPEYLKLPALHYTTLYITITLHFTCSVCKSLLIGCCRFSLCTSDYYMNVWVLLHL